MINKIAYKSKANKKTPIKENLRKTEREWSNMEAKSKIENVNTHGHAFANFLRNNLGPRLRRVKGKGSMLDGGLKGKNKIRQFHFSGSAV